MIGFTQYKILGDVVSAEKIKPEDYWRLLGELEVEAINNSFHILRKLDLLAEKCMTLALKSPFLKGNRSGSYSLSIAALFLKRAMSDFRGAWLLLNRGYPYQAACVVASLYEHASIVNCICDRDDLAKVAISGKDGDITWKPVQLAKMCAQKDLFGEIKHKNPEGDIFDNAWRAEYHNYKLLCKMKHPTMQQLQDEASMTLTDKGQFVVAARPDNRQDSLGLKQLIMVIAIMKLISATKNFAKATDCNADEDGKVFFEEELFVFYQELTDFIKESEVAKAKIHVYGYSFFEKG